MDDWKLLEYLVGGSLVILGLVLAFVVLSFAAMVILPFAIGYLIALLLQKAYYRIFPPPYEPVCDTAPRPLTIWEERYTWKREEPKPYVAPVIKELPKEVEETPVVSTEKKVEEEPDEEFDLDKNFYVERKLSHREKEALFAQGYSRLKVSPYGESGSAYYWVKTRYNESKEHAFFCYLIEKELRKYTKEVDLFVNSGPDVIVRRGGHVYAFDVETGKNLIRKPEETKAKFERYKNDYFRSYVFVTNKSLKRKYHKFGIVITRSTFKKVISDIFY